MGLIDDADITDDINIPVWNPDGATLEDQNKRMTLAQLATYIQATPLPYIALGDNPPASGAIRVDGSSFSGLLLNAINNTNELVIGLGSTLGYIGTATANDFSFYRNNAALLTYSGAAFYPETTNIIDLGLTGKRFKSLFLSGNLDVTGNIVIGGNITITGNVAVTGNITAALVTSTFSGNLTGNVTGNLTGLASSASVLNPGRTINGVAFDGSTNITVTAAAGTLTGTTLAANVVTSSLTSVGTLDTLTVASLITVSAGGITVTGNSTITGTLGGLTGLTVVSGGASITGDTFIIPTAGAGKFRVTSAATPGAYFTTYHQAQANELPECQLITNPETGASGNLALFTGNGTAGLKVGAYYYDTGNAIIRAGWELINGAHGGANGLLSLMPTGGDIRVGNNYGSISEATNLVLYGAQAVYPAGTETLRIGAGGFRVAGNSVITGDLAVSGTITGTYAAAAGSLTGTTLAANVVTSSITTIGTLIAGAVPASLVTAGTFGAGSYVTTGSLTSSAFIPSGSTVPTNGMYLPAANTVGFATNTVLQLSILTTGITVVGNYVSTAGKALFGAAPGSGSAINVDIATHTSILGMYNGATLIGQFSAVGTTDVVLTARASVNLNFAANNITKWFIPTEAAGTSSLRSSSAIANIRSGATSFNIQDSTGAANNLAITDSGLVTLRNTLTVTLGTITASRPAISSTVTWDNIAIAFIHNFVNITNTNSAAGALIAQWQVGGANQFTVSKAGLVDAKSYAVNGAAGVSGTSTAGTGTVTFVNGIVTAFT